MPVLMKIRNIDRIKNAFLSGLGIRSTVRIVLIVQGPAAAYALVWEWGRIGIRPGPKTQWGSNPEGGIAVMTKTAPSGFIRVNRAKYRQIIREEFAAHGWSRTKPENFDKNIVDVLKYAAARCADLTADTAPIDTGQLRAAIRIARIDQADTDITTDILYSRGRLKKAQLWRKSRGHLKLAV